MLSDPGPAPPVFLAPVGVYDPIRHRLLVLESGLNGILPNPGVQALELDPQPHWSTLASAAPDAARNNARLIYDPLRERLLLCGGWTDLEVWALPLTGIPAWTPVAATGTRPPGRERHSAIYDAVRDRMIIFGGDSSGVERNDAWALSLGTYSWSRLTPSGPLPPGRSDHVAIYDPAHDRMLVFAGNGGLGTRFNDLWALGLGGTVAWTELHPNGPAPSPRSAFGAAYDPIRQRMWIQGGVSPDEVWALDLTAAPTWIPIATADTLYGRSYPVVAYESNQDRLLVYGGMEYAQTSVLSLTTPYRWEQIAPTQPPPAPGPRSQHAVVFDSRRNRLLAMGGSYGTTDVDTWSFVPDDPGDWAALLRPGAPSAFGIKAVYDSLEDQLVAFDGLLWTSALSSGPVWTPFVAVGPMGPRSQPSMVLDTRRHRIILYGGLVLAPHHDSYTVADVWSYPLDGPPAWTLLGYGPVARGTAGQAAFYDPVGDRMIVMGGYWQNASVFTHPYGATVWAAALDGPLVWTTLDSSLAVPAPPEAQVCYDAARDRILLFADSTVWSRPLHGAGSWTMLDATGPAPVVSGPVVYDRVRDQAVALFSARRGAPLDQAWALHFAPPPTPPRPALTLLGTRPNPSVGAICVVLSLPDASPARLELFDIGGRRITALEIGGLGPGTHALALGSGTFLKPGVYLIRLQHAGQSYAARAVVLR
jgi:hypothetical protein